MVNILLIPHFLEYKLDIIISPKLRSNHKRSHLPLIQLRQLLTIMPMQYLHIFRRLERGRIMHRFPAEAIPNIELRDMLKDVGQEFGVGVYDGAMDRAEEIGGTGLL